MVKEQSLFVLDNVIIGVGRVTKLFFINLGAE